MSEAASESTPADTSATPSIDSRILALRHKVATVDTVAPNTELVKGPSVDPDTAVELKTAAASHLANANAMRREVKALEDQIRKEMELKLAEARALMAPLQEKIAQSNEVISTLNLYLGRDEEIILLADGEPAPASSPLTVRQMVLSMDEETALYSDEGGDAGGMDFRDLAQFDEWLLSNPQHLQQILPEERGVVALVPRRRGQNYKDPWMNKRGAEENNHTYWLIRNGQKLWRMDTKIDVGLNLVPARDEFTGLFRVKKFNYTTRQDEWYDLVPGSTEWMQAEKAQGARQRHFFRIALILQGLIDRTKIFYPLPEGGISLLHPESYESGKAVMLADGERTLQSSRKPFYEWLKELNEQLRPGMRFIGSFRHTDFTSDVVENYRRGTTHRRITPRGASYPASMVIHQVEKVDGRKLFFKYDRTDKVWTADGDYRPPLTRASAWVGSDEKFILPIDFVDVPTMREYLSARTERHAYLDMFALLKRAIAIKEQEAAAEAPFREYLAASVAAELQMDIEEVRPTLGEVVDWWKLGNKWHRPLVKGEDPAAEAKAVRMITAEFKARHAGASNTDASTDASVVAKLRAMDSSIMFVGRRSTGGYLAFAPQSRKYGAAQGFRDDLWVIEYTMAGPGSAPAKREWVLPGSRWRKTATVFEAEKWAGWDTVTTNYREHLTDDEIDGLLADLEAGVVQTVNVDGYQQFRNSATVTDPEAELFAVTYDKGSFAAWVHSPALAVREPNRGERRLEALYLRVDAKWRKSAKGEVEFVEYPEHWWFRETGHWMGPGDDKDALRPWSSKYMGRQQGPDAIILREGPWAKYMAWHHEVELQKAESAKRSNLIWSYIRVAQDAANQFVVDQLRERYLEDYQDPDGWADHLKTIKVPHVQIGTAVNSHTPDPHPLDGAVKALVRSGANIEGRTVREVLEKSGAAPEAITRVIEEGIADVILTSGK